MKWVKAKNNVKLQILFRNPLAALQRIKDKTNLFLPISNTKTFPKWSPAANDSPHVLKAT